jgi:hypothetical protein
MRLGTEDALTVALQRLGFSGRLNTAFSERAPLTVRDAGGRARTPHLGNSSAVPTAAGQFGVVARPLSFCTSSRSAAGSAPAAARTRGQTCGATLSAANGSSCSRKNPSTLDGSRGALLSLAKGFHLRTTHARCRCSVMPWSGWARCKQKQSDGVSLEGEMACLDCPLTKKPAPRGLQRLFELSTMSHSSTRHFRQQHLLFPRRLRRGAHRGRRDTIIHFSRLRLVGLTVPVKGSRYSLQRANACGSNTSSSADRSNDLWILVKGKATTDITGYICRRRVSA